MGQIRARATLMAAAGMWLGLSACELYVVDHASQLPPQVVQPALSTEPKPEPLPGSDLVVFMDSTTAQLAGCRAISNIRFSASPIIVGKFITNSGSDQATNNH